VQVGGVRENSRVVPAIAIAIAVTIVLTLLLEELVRTVTLDALQIDAGPVVLGKRGRRHLDDLELHAVFLEVDACARSGRVAFPLDQLVAGRARDEEDVRSGHCRRESYPCAAAT